MITPEEKLRNCETGHGVSVQLRRWQLKISLSFYYLIGGVMIRILISWYVTYNFTEVSGIDETNKQEC